MPVKIIWKSEIFPKFTLNEIQLKLLQRDFPSLAPFAPILRDIERYIVNNPETLSSIPHEDEKGTS